MRSRPGVNAPRHVSFVNSVRHNMAETHVLVRPVKTVSVVSVAKALIAPMPVTVTSLDTRSKRKADEDALRKATTPKEGTIVTTIFLSQIM